MLNTLSNIFISVFETDFSGYFYSLVSLGFVFLLFQIFKK